MDRLNKPFGPITTLVIIYLGLVMVSVAIYALIQMYVEEKELAASLLSWSATIFATIALLYTFNSWKFQKKLEEIANLAKYVDKKLKENNKVFLEIATYIDTINQLSEYTIQMEEAKKLNKYLNTDINLTFELKKIHGAIENKIIKKNIEKYLKEYELFHTYIGQTIYEYLGFGEQIKEKVEITSIIDFFENYKNLSDSITDVYTFNY